MIPSAARRRNDILYQWKTDERLLARDTFIGERYNKFSVTAARRRWWIMANVILEGVYFYSGFLFFYNLARIGEVHAGPRAGDRYMSRDENTHLWLFTNIMRELREENPELLGSGGSPSCTRCSTRECVRRRSRGELCDRGRDRGPELVKMLERYMTYLGELRCGWVTRRRRACRTIWHGCCSTRIPTW